MTRSYIRSSIQELETLFETHRDDVSVLKALEDELTHPNLFCQRGPRWRYYLRKRSAGLKIWLQEIEREWQHLIGSSFPGNAVKSLVPINPCIIRSCSALYG